MLYFDGKVMKKYKLAKKEDIVFGMYFEYRKNLNNRILNDDLKLDSGWYEATFEPKSRNEFNHVIIYSSNPIESEHGYPRTYEEILWWIENGGIRIEV